MKRSDFLRTFGLGAGGVLLTNLFVASKHVKIYYHYVRGLMHYKILELEDQLKGGDSVSLVREITNSHDSFAIQVTWREHYLGYVAPFENIVIANMPDAGLNLSASLARLIRPEI